MGDSTSAAHAHVEEVMQDVACPGCEYNLRGLYGPVVNCPECGQRCDIARIVRLKWTLPWYRAPKFNQIVAPVTWAVIMPLPLVALITGGYLVGAILGTIVITGWFFCLYKAYRVFDSFFGVSLALLAHVIFIAYLIFVMYCVRWGVSIMQHDLVPLAGASVGLPLTFGAAYLARRGERWIAEQCIREYLRRQSAALDSPS